MSEHPEIAAGTPAPARMAPAPLTVVETAIAAAWNIQGDPGHAPFMDAVEREFGIRLPRMPNTSAREGALVALWLGPASWLLVRSDRANPPSTVDDFEAMRDALNTGGGALFDVSASRVAFTLSGARAGIVLAKRCPLDFHPSAFPPGGCAQSLFGHVNALFYRPDASSFVMWVARSFARDVWHALGELTRTGGS